MFAAKQGLRGLYKNCASINEVWRLPIVLPACRVQYANKVQYRGNALDTSSSAYHAQIQHDSKLDVYFVQGYTDHVSGVWRHIYLQIELDC